MATIDLSLPANVAPRTRSANRWGWYAPFVGVGILLTALAQIAGSHSIDLGIGTVTLYPLIWGILLGAAVSLQRVRPVPVRLQRASAYFVEIGILLLAARLSLLVGPNLGVLADAGPAVLLQEFGHLLGTVLFALPIAVLLRMGRSTVGATFSIDREGSFAMVSERYGPDSDEYRGVLAMYIFGTVFGALYVTLLASFLASTGILDPLALAMGAGVGSGSVMAASAAAIAEQFPAVADQVLAVAAISNLVTSALGLYVGMYVALPLAERFYRALTRRQTASAPLTTDPQDTGSPDAGPADVSPDAAPAAEQFTPPSLWVTLPTMLVGMILAVAVFGGGLNGKAVSGFAIIAALLGAGLLLKRTVGLSAIIGVSTLGILVSSSWSPFDASVVAMTEPIEFLALTTPVLVFAGLGVGKDAAVLRRVGWRIFPVGMVSFAASFLLSAVIAQFALGL